MRIGHGTMNSHLVTLLSTVIVIDVPRGPGIDHTTHNAIVEERSFPSFDACKKDTQFAAAGSHNECVFVPIISKRNP